mgnify:FL=1
MMIMRKMTTTVLISMLTGAMAILISGCSNNSTSQSTKTTSTSADTQVASSENTTANDITTTVDGSAENVTSIKKGGYLAIPIADLSQTASFYKADLDGTEIELVALKDSKGNLRTAFNACQVCYSSGRGYYRQEGKYLVCQNCGNSFTIDQVGIASGGCNPWPILDSDRTVTDDEIQISYDVLKATADELPKFFQ